MVYKPPRLKLETCVISEPATVQYHWIPIRSKTLCKSIDANAIGNINHVLSITAPMIVRYKPDSSRWYDDNRKDMRDNWNDNKFEPSTSTILAIMRLSNIGMSY
jgi:hypothetical protein